MIIGILFAGILLALGTMIAALVAGFPIWLALMLYPVVGTIGAMGFVALALLLKKRDDADDMTACAVVAR
ncbi:hypothetical protein EOK75_10470 [Pseudorhodobacter turbinis]|uniref:Uncharacterized protein n=1 Tax=Pseudorhodobacter turbinis TaxID=2500533 RepID=A0A4P8EGR8_9RHOB|nr:hypothetical protein [Pseudorhodobacter turbinis]QCO56116.1 hypothetical protein EOK75_10470 [Pseudorhodobacter turbinis]